MAKKPASDSKKAVASGKPSSLVDTRVIYCGDNLEQLKKLPAECVDLIYIDPPFNSNRNYEVFWGETKEKRAFDDRHASTQAYIDFMLPRCVELHRVLKKTGSFYYHCDWHASHYVKIMLDRQVFGENNFQNEIVWKRTSAHNDPNKYGNVNDSIFFYTKSDAYTWNPQYQPYDEDYLETFFDEKDSDGRRYKRMDLTGAGVTKGESGEPWRGIDVSSKGRHWAYSPSKLDEFDKQGRIHWPKKSDGMPRLKQYVEDLPGVPLQNVWTDIRPLHNLAAERLGYPTQKPLALLDRIIKASSNPNDIVLDAFCGCGTALVAAENLDRQWIGIDVSPTACNVMAKRLRDVCKMKQDEKLWQIGRGFVVRDLPWTIEKLRAIPPFEFENWAVIALGGRPNVAKVGDMGIDGRIYPISAMPKKDKGELGFMDVWYPIQVKQTDKVGRPDVDKFEAVMAREDRTQGFFVSFDYSSDAMHEIEAFFKKTGKIIRAITVKDILDEQIAYKLA
ncbi:MAG: DNA methyltransferase [Sedimentisphaerales bacterium]|jgi:site-specific DNA-methyltransferase (adenine-specific)